MWQQRETTDRASDSAVRRDCSATSSTQESARRSSPDHAPSYGHCSRRLSGEWEVGRHAAGGGETALARHCAFVGRADIDVVKPFEGLGSRKRTASRQHVNALTLHARTVFGAEAMKHAGGARFIHRHNVPLLTRIGNGKVTALHMERRGPGYASRNIGVEGVMAGDPSRKIVRGAKQSDMEAGQGACPASIVSIFAAPLVVEWWKDVQSDSGFQDSVGLGRFSGRLACMTANGRSAHHTLVSALGAYRFCSARMSKNSTQSRATLYGHFINPIQISTFYVLWQ